MRLIQDFLDLEVQRGEEVVSLSQCSSRTTFGMSLRASWCSNSGRHGQKMIHKDYRISMAIGTNVRVSSRTVCVVLASKGESSAGAEKNSGKKYEGVEEKEVADSDTYEMESGSLVQNTLAAILLGALGLSAINIIAKIGVITIALISVAVRYSIIGILIVVLVCLVG